MLYESENLYVLCCASPVPIFVASPIDDQAPACLGG